VDKNGHRKVFCISLGYQEDKPHGGHLIKSLKERGLISLDLTISDAGKSLVNALKEEFSGIPHRRCIVHYEEKCSKVICIIPNAKSCIRYVSCLLMEVDYTTRRVKDI